jgi:AcrR family transcriptional regulator
VVAGDGRQAIVTAARAEFAERGFAATSIRDIARRAGMSLSALYHYYPGKQDLLYAIVDEVTTAYFAACEAELAKTGEGPADRLEALVTATVRFRVEHPARSGVVINELRSLTPANLAQYQARTDHATRLFRDTIRSGVDGGDFRTPWPDDARRAVIAMCNAVADWYDPTGPVTPDELVERYVALAFVIVEFRPRSTRRS